MKKLLLYFLLIAFSQLTNAATIQNISVSRISDETINIHVGTMDGSCYVYSSFQYNISGNIITLEICYERLLCQAVTYSQDDFQIPLNNTSTDNFSLSVKTYFSTSFGCNFGLLIDSQTVPFSTPVNTTIVLLSNVDFNDLNNNFIIFPNPSNGVLQIRNESNQIREVKVYDSLNRLVKVYTNNYEIIDLTELIDGIYLVELNTEKGKFIKKIVLEK
jgi:hypothetical protein